ncbi:MAG: (E)-4-hydroxy-3-methylbut-2-enyl-diphosphate synthase [bacterium]|jgi:(E)-4-hydroxy-3-methylbut-2-enyl-diphosphate synthase
MMIKYPLQYQRRKTREVRVGNVIIGGNQPICIQSMLTTPASQTELCFTEIQGLANVDCELIRITIPSSKELDAIPEIRRRMKEEGILIPLVADVHFVPKLAMNSCELFEKVRINPGNFSDRSKNSIKQDKGESFEDGRERLKELIIPLAKNLKRYDCAVRIGVNQGSLSTRMMEKYGDSPVGMVESALETINLFEEQNFDQIIVSLKSSNPIIVQKAYRLLSQQLPELATPLHLGVTEAGNGLMGRIKSVAGIGALLADGIGDTIRVSLTEPAHEEVIFAKQFLQSFNFQEDPVKSEFLEIPLEQNRVKNSSVTYASTDFGGGSHLKLGHSSESVPAETDFPVEWDFQYTKKEQDYFLKGQSKPILQLKKLSDLQKDLSNYSSILFDFENPVFQTRKFYESLKNQSCDLPCGIVLPNKELGKDYLFETQLATLLGEGYLDFVLIPENISSDLLTQYLFLLQATRSKIFTTDYIACPSCGRTQFDLQATTQRIKEETSHLAGIKIGVMGCIVNGPGEMADADVGYVGSGVGKIDLYLGQKQIRKNVPEEEAVEALIHLIKEQGMWKDKDDNFKSN